MKALIFKKNGELFLLNRFTQEEEKVETVKNYLDCPTILEDGITFETFFNHIIKEKEFFNIVYSETMGESSIDNFIEEWELPSTDILTQKGLTYLKSI